MRLSWARNFNSWTRDIESKSVKVLGLFALFVDFGSQRIESLGDRNILEITDFFGFRTPKKLKFDYLAKRMSSDSFTICGERI